MKLLQNKSYLYEIPIFYALLVYFNFLFYTSDIGFFHVSPHPFWLGIFLFAFRYDFFASLCSSFISASLYVLFAWSPWNLWQGVPEYLLHDREFYFVPAAFFVSSVLVSWGIARLQLKIKEVKRQNRIYKANEVPLKNEIDTLQKINLELEKKVVTQMSTLVTMYEGAKNLESTSLETIYETIIHFFSKILEADQASVHIRKGDKWVLKYHYKPLEKYNVKKSIDLNQGIIGGAASQNKIFSVRDILDKDKIVNLNPDDVDAMIAGPLCKGENGTILAVYSIQKISLLKFNSATLNLLKFLLSWASRSFGKAYDIMELKEQNVFDNEYGIFTQGYFRQRLEDEFVRAKTYYLPLSLALIKIQDIKNLKSEKKHKLLEVLSQLIKSTCRNGDVVCHLQNQEAHIAVILVTCTIKNAQKVKERILENFSLIDFEKIIGQPIALNIGLSSFSPKTVNEDMLLNEAKQEMVNL